MRDKRSLYFAIVPLVLAGCSEVGSAKLGFIACFLLALPLLLVQVVVTTLGQDPGSKSAGSTPVASAALTALGALVTVQGITLVLDVSGPNRTQVLGHLVALLACELMMLGMTIRLFEARSHASKSEPTLPMDDVVARQAPATATSIFPWVAGGYVALSTGLVVALLP